MSENIESTAAVKDKDALAAPAEGRPRGRKRRKVSYLTLNKIETLDYKDVNVLRRFLNDRGKILSARQTGATAKQQRMIARAIRRARELALLPYVVTDFLQDRRDIVGRPGRGYGRSQAAAEAARAEAALEDAVEAAVEAADDVGSEPIAELAPEASILSSEQE